jgi:hypothetical protein
MRSLPLVRCAQLAALLAGTSLFAGCVFAPVVPPRGILFNDQTSPLTTQGRAGSKEGRASSHNVLFLLGWGNSGLNAAMENGDIQEVRHVDYRIQNYLLLYQRYTTIVRGE